MAGKATITAILLIGLILLSGCTQPTGQFTTSQTQERIRSCPFECCENEADYYNKSCDNSTVYECVRNVCENRCRTETYTETICEDTPYIEQECQPETYTEQECTTKEIPYKVEDWHLTHSNCTKSEDECKQYGLFGVCTKVVTYCMERKVGGQGELYNLDNEKRGLFPITFELRRTGTSHIFDTGKMNYSPYPQSSTTFGWSFTITGREDADKTGYFVSHKISPATKQVCQTVTKTRQGCRNVTKYRRECNDVERTRQVCN